VTASLFVYPEDVRFECSRCGDCCRGPDIRLTDEEGKAIRALDWTGRVDELSDETATERIDRGLEILRKRADGACVFLGTRDQCMLHEHFGEAHKPLMCRIFPFGFYEVGGRVAVDVSFACRAVSERMGPKIGDQVDSWAATLRRPEPGARDRHRFSKKFDCDGELLWEIEEVLLGLVDQPESTMMERVRLLAEFARLALTSDPSTEAARTLREVMAKALPAQIRARSSATGMDKTQRALFFHLLFLHLNPTPASLRGLSSKARAKEARLRVEAANGFERPDTHPWIDNRALEVGFGAVGEVGLGYLGTDEGTRHIAAYMRAKILGQRFMREGSKELPLIEALPRWLMLYPMWLWTSKAVAAERGLAEVERADARQALRLLDRSYAQIDLSGLPAKQRKAWAFIFMETDFPSCASFDMTRRTEARS